MTAKVCALGWPVSDLWIVNLADSDACQLVSRTPIDWVLGNYYIQFVYLGILVKAARLAEVPFLDQSLAKLVRFSWCDLSWREFFHSHNSSCKAVYNDDLRPPTLREWEAAKDSSIPLQGFRRDSYPFALRLKLSHTVGSSINTQVTVRHLMLCDFESQKLSWNILKSRTFFLVHIQGGGGRFKDRKPIGEVCCRDAWVPERTQWWIDRLLRLWVSLYLSLSVSSSLCLCLSLCLFLVLFLSLSPSLSLCLYLYICLPVYLFIYLDPSLSISLSIPLSLSI